MAPKVAASIPAMRATNASFSTSNEPAYGSTANSGWSKYEVPAGMVISATPTGTARSDPA